MTEAIRNFFSSRSIFNQDGGDDIRVAQSAIVSVAIRRVLSCSETRTNCSHHESRCAEEGCAGQVGGKTATRHRLTTVVAISSLVGYVELTRERPRRRIGSAASC